MHQLYIDIHKYTMHNTSHEYLLILNLKSKLKYDLNKIHICTAAPEARTPISRVSC